MITVIGLFLKTLFYHFLLRGKSEQECFVIRQKWSQMILKDLKVKLHVTGSAPSGKNIILVGNHISFLDIPVLMAALPEVRFIAKDDILRWPIIGSAAQVCGAIFVKRGSPFAGKKAKKDILNAMEKECKIVFFPSATTTLHEEKPWKKGAFEIAKEQNIPLQLFCLEYQPLRECAYIDDDVLLIQMKKILKTPHKQVFLHWMGSFLPEENSALLAEKLRQTVIQKREAK
jgi:1-acyl-sn-glycerol-3-phosphate acyltransferase